MKRCIYGYILPIIAMIAVISLTCGCTEDKEPPTGPGGSGGNTRKPPLPPYDFPDPETLYGQEEWVTAISHLGVTASWNGTNPGRESREAIYNPAPGWVVIEHKTIIHSNSNGNHSVDTLAEGLNMVTEEDIGHVYNSAIDMLAKYDAEGLAAKLKEEMSERVKEVRRYSTNKNTIKANVSAQAHGSMFDRKRGWIDLSVEARLRYIGAPDRSSLAKEIEGEYKIDIPALGYYPEDYPADL